MRKETDRRILKGPSADSVKSTLKCRSVILTAAQASKSTKKYNEYYFLTYQVLITLFVQHT